ncbi:DNA excision repair protein ERCC-6-like [Physella acuta]|uniref:DNA excision repair protein ERCC-6-like n=1 Tax=Physella acuta TaxID=109671 RepID=UPI0027DD1C8F|nr:DNA excision repair protein ERCC-6-like [Physella acuta]XP_059174900.1 DNA excision repair protein ERCC-6-like [Physella acuta]XP_059174901.1 DNA excision repair protein ERCC-6-like [Physella acuta]
MNQNPTHDLEKMGCSIEMSGVNLTDHDEEKRASQNDAFHVNTSLIPQATLDEQGLELQELGLSVFNQDVLEQGIMDQVDQALVKEEKKRLEKILKNELKVICDDILLVKKDLEHIMKSEKKLELGEMSSDIRRQLEGIKKQRSNKNKQLKTLMVRQENVKKKLQLYNQDTESVEEEADSMFNQAFQIGTQKETEKERMIRTGEMTPFGTVMKPAALKPVHPREPNLSEFEKVLMAKELPSVKVKKDFEKYVKRKSLKTSNEMEHTGSNVSWSVRKKQKRESTEPDFKKAQQTHSTGVVYSTRHQQRIIDCQASANKDHMEDEHNNIEEQDDDSGDAESNNDEEEYRPSNQELMGESSDNYTSIDEDGETLEDESKKRKKSKRSSFPRKKPRKIPKYIEDDETKHEEGKVKRDLSYRRERDDADPEYYQQRLLRQQRLDEKEEKIDDMKLDDENDDSEFDGGLRVPPRLWSKLFKYQKTGVRWLWELHCQQVGGIVGDEMGLGKTIQTIAFLAALRTSQVKNVNFPYKGLGPSIIVCPTTVMHQWLKEFHKWWPDFRVAILHSSGSFTGSESEMVRSVAKSSGILITSYNTLVIHQELVLRFNWHYVILDEGHKIRNPDAKVTLVCKQFRTPHRIILSGSPIQNNLKELWSLFDFIFPGKLGTLPDFMQHFSIPIVQGGYSNATQVQVETAYRCACVLRDTINPYLIRRMKADVKKNLDLPNKNEQVLFCRLTEEQRDVYKEYLDSRECNAILQGKFQVFAGLITLRKICNHPDLSTGGPQFFHSDCSETDPEYQFGYHKRSGKMIVVEALLRLWYKQKHRVLLFTQSKSMLNILEKFAAEKGYSYLIMDGGTAISARQPLISQFNNTPSIYLFLLTTRVGGLGVNLTGADRVIIYDPDWNPSTDVQARERAWRIGQTKQVTIYRLLTSGTIEEKIYHRQIFKQFLTNRVLKDPKQRRLFKSQDLMELFTLGCDNNEEGTETSALFAGTGSDVKVSKRSRKNRFDEMKDKKELKTSENKDNKSVDEENMGLDNEELERMKELARNLSRKMEEEKRKRESERRASEDSTKLFTPSDEVEEVQPVTNDKKDDELKSLETTVVCDNGEEIESKVVSEESTSSALSQIGDSKNSHSGSIPNKWHSNGKKWTIPMLKRNKEERSTPQDIDHRGEEKRQKTEEKRRRSHTDEEKDDDKTKKKKKLRNARFEGERIPNLVKHCSLSTADQSDEQPSVSTQKKDNKREDDYVLKQLFKKTGLQGAMKHEKIMDSGRPDYAIVEAEAEKVAREAVAALRRSRQQCASAMSGLPTWTGQHGGLAKPRFGQKKNSLLVVNKSAPSETPQITSQKSATEKDKLFDGSVSGTVSLSTKDNSLTSQDLLSRMRARKRISTASVSTEDEDFLRPDVPENLDPKDEELLKDIRNFVAFMANTDGEASTQEIVLNFGTRLPKSDAPKFKAMLNQICDFRSGVWRLKTEFR